MKHSFKDYFLATRPWSFPASVMPVLIGLGYIYFTSSEYSSINWLNGLLSIFGMVLYHSAGNLISDYYDFRNGVDSDETHGATALVDGSFKPKTIRNFGLICLILGSIIGGYLLLNAGMGLLWIGICGIISALFYYFLKVRALGDVLVLFAFGILPLVGTGYVLTSSFIISMAYLGITIGLLTVAILHANNVRDMTSDGKAHIKTLAMLIGLGASKVFYTFLLLAPFVFVIVLYFLNIIPIASFLTFLSIPIAIRNIRTMNAVENDLNHLVGLDMRTAQLQMIFGILFSIGFLF